MTTLVVLIFALTYVLIAAARRLTWLPLGRPASALLGAVLVVAVGALTPRESYAAIDHDTIVLLLGMMLLTAYLDRASFFEVLARQVIRLGGTPVGILMAVGALSGVLSAFLVNDAVCLFLTPVVVATCRRARLPFGPFLIAVATCANLGSAATLVGNPQNMIIGSLSGYGFASFLLRAAPAAVIGLLLNLVLLRLYYRRALPSRVDSAEDGPAPIPDRGKLVLTGVVTVGIVAGFFLGGHLGYTALAGVLVLILIDRRNPQETFARVDWPLLVFFCGLFVVVAALRKTGLVDDAWGAARPYLGFHTAGGLASFTAAMTAGSNLVSNVPMVLLAGPHLSAVGDPGLGWVLLAFTTTVAGNLTLVGSVANIIVAESAREHYALGFREYLRFGFVSTLLVLAAGVPAVWLTWRLLGA
ncbi:MAG: anion transporter [Deltaproteobacteria bacterium]|nr:anion transporter [Deltaproteobacteria bacterium]